MECKHLSGEEKNECMNNYCKSKNSSESSNQSCICEKYCCGSNCETENSWNVSCEGDSDDCSTCDDCTCVSSVPIPDEICPGYVIHRSNSDTVEEVTDSPVVTPLPIESTITPSPEFDENSSKYLKPFLNKSENELDKLNKLKNHSKIFRFIISKLVPTTGERESLSFIYQKYDNWYKMYYSDNLIEDDNKFRLIFYKLFVDFEGEYLLNIKYDEFKVLNKKDIELLGEIEVVQKNEDLLKYANNNLEISRRQNTNFNDIYLDYSDWIIKNSEQKQKSIYELDNFLTVFFEKKGNNLFTNLKIKNSSSKVNISSQYEVLSNFFYKQVKTDEGSILSFEQIYNQLVVWFNKNHPDEVLINRNVLLTYLRSNYKEVSDQVFENIKFIDGEKKIKDDIINKFFEVKLINNPDGNVNLEQLYKSLITFRKKNYPENKTPDKNYLKNKLDQNFKKNNDQTYQLKIKNGKKKIFFLRKIGNFLKNNLKYIIILIVLILILYLIYYFVKIKKRPKDHFKQTLLFKQFLPYHKK